MAADLGARAQQAGYLFLLPWLIGFFGLTLGPVLASLYLSFTDFDLLRDPRWIGLDNYVRIATNDPKFATSMRVTFSLCGAGGAVQAGASRSRSR